MHHNLALSGINSFMCYALSVTFNHEIRYALRILRNHNISENISKILRSLLIFYYEYYLLKIFLNSMRI